MLRQRRYGRSEHDFLVGQVVYAELHISDVRRRIFGVGASKREAPTVARRLNFPTEAISRCIDVSDLSASRCEHETRTIAGHGQHGVAHKGGRVAARLGNVYSRAAGWPKQARRLCRSGIIALVNEEVQRSFGGRCKLIDNLGIGNSVVAVPRCHFELLRNERVGDPAHRFL
jgi:hypothetical protein